MPTQSSIHPRKLSQARRQALLLEASPTIQRLAARYTYTFRVPMLEAADLAQIGCVEALEAMQRGIHPSGSKVGYLVGVARFGMLRYCGQHRTGITTPRKARGYYEPLAVLSLDAPLSDDSDLTLLDLLADEAMDAAEEYACEYENWLDCQP